MLDKIKTVAFAFAITAFFTILVSGINASLQDTIENNRLLARQRVIVELFDFEDFPLNADDEKVQAFFDERIIRVDFAQEKIIEAYKLKKAGDSRYVFAFSGQGFWDTITGYIAMDVNKMQTTGIQFTGHGETPGLGGRITEPEFMERLQGLDIKNLRSDGLYFKFVSEGSAGQPDEVDGITGATGTTSALENILNRALKTFVGEITSG